MSPGRWSNYIWCHISKLMRVCFQLNRKVGFWERPEQGHCLCLVCTAGKCEHPSFWLQRRLVILSFCCNDASSTLQRQQIEKSLRLDARIKTSSNDSSTVQMSVPRRSTLNDVCGVLLLSRGTVTQLTLFHALHIQSWNRVSHNRSFLYHNEWQTLPSNSSLQLYFRYYVRL